MFLSKFRRRNSVVERIEEWTQPPTLPFAEVNAAYHPHKQTITVNVPATVDGALLATQIEHQLKRRGSFATCKCGKSFTLGADHHCAHA